MMRTSQQGIDFIKSHEGFRATMYLDAVGKPTIGYGTLIDTPAEQWLRTATITEKQAEELLRNDLVAFEQAVANTITVRLAQNQFDALVSFVYNLGPAALRNGSLPRLINGRADALTISAKWAEYRMAGGRVLPGLVKRRSQELQMFWQHLWKLGSAAVIVAGVLTIAAAITLQQ